MHFRGKDPDHACALGLAAVAAAQEHRPGDVELKPGTLQHFSTNYDVQFGTLRVPMDHRDPNSPLLALQFVHSLSISPDPGPPVVYLAGGPGGIGIGSVRSSRASTFLDLLDRHDFIAFDQRGTGRSEPSELSIGEPIQMPLDEPVDLDAMCKTAQGVARNALDMLASRDIDPWAFTTEQSADDLDLLRTAVGAEQLIL